MNRAWILVIILLLILLVSQVIKARMETLEARRKLLLVKWKAARNRRQLWKEEHLSYFDFNNPEYQTLWEQEIGSEDLYLLNICFWCKGVSISWSDYCFERKEAKALEQGE